MKGLRHVGIVVKDLEKALHFYRDLLGFKQIKKMDEKGSYIDAIYGIKNIEVTTIKLAADDNNLIELLYFSIGAGKISTISNLNDTGFSHISCTVENIVNEYDRMKKAGVHFISAPQVSFDRYAKVAFCQDPEGNFIELVEVLSKK
ncbi:MAG: VOC family protein [Candidatus Omnitrophica bacterium]|nr:VOC family protein [Candidatus Omnitrophota bacterium]